MNLFNFAKENMQNEFKQIRPVYHITRESWPEFAGDYAFQLESTSKQGFGHTAWEAIVAAVGETVAKRLFAGEVQQSEYRWNDSKKLAQSVLTFPMTGNGIGIIFKR